MKTILEKSQSEVLKIFTTNFSGAFMFHNYSRTVSKVKNALTICESLQLNEKSTEDLLIACWFAETGFSVFPDNYLEKSETILKSFLEQEQFESSRIEKICSYIFVAAGEKIPETEEEQILHDANYQFLAAKSFNEEFLLLRQEYKSLGIKKSKDSWFDAFSSVKYYTAFALENWETKKALNILSINKKKVDKNKLKDQIKATKKGADTVFRITLKNHISLSDNADRKAHILLSVNAIIISIILSRLFPKFDSESNHFLYVPTIIFLIFTIISMIMSILATRPRITSQVYTKEAFDYKKINILFFGNFYKMPYDNFQDQMLQIMDDHDALYNSLIKDLYYLGKVVARKYILLRYTYALFMVGILVSTLAYFISFNIYY
ncbi:Pycsar system effector family protein [Zhouia sp. PK063]|uniref:Pycsar system effector family protein n=1 Tax=Zhouia sp. PK063 TaxID=3373602 RepID=UPI0037988426